MNPFLLRYRNARRGARRPLGLCSCLQCSSLLVPSVLLSPRASPPPLSLCSPCLPTCLPLLGTFRPSAFVGLLSSVLSLPLPLSSPYVSMSSKPSPSICLSPCPTALLRSSYPPSSTLPALPPPGPCQSPSVGPSVPSSLILPYTPAPCGSMLYASSGPVLFLPLTASFFLASLRRLLISLYSRSL